MANPLVVVGTASLLAVLSIFLAVFSLAQFKIAYALLASLTQKHYPFAEFVQPCEEPSTGDEGHAHTKPGCTERWRLVPRSGAAVHRHDQAHVWIPRVVHSVGDPRAAGAEGWGAARQQHPPGRAALVGLASHLTRRLTRRTLALQVAILLAVLARG
jgi:hypothetical protein